MSRIFERRTICPSNTQSLGYPSEPRSSELVQVITQLGHLHLDVLSLARLQNQLLQLAALLRGIPLQILPMIEHALREGLSAGCLTQSSDEAEGLGDREVSLDLDQWRALTRVLLENTPAPQVHAIIDTTHGLLWACDLNQEHGLLQSRLRDQLCSETAPTCGGHNLPSTTVNGIGVQSDIHNVEPNASHVLLTQWSFFCGPLESTVDVLLDFDEILHALRLVNHHVSTLGFWAPAPDLPSCVFVPIELLAHELRALLHFGLGARLSILNGCAELVGHGLRREVDPIVLVGRLRQARHGG